MIPHDLFALPTLKAVMEARGDTPENEYACRCGRTLPADSFACTDGLGADLPRFVCFTCASHAHRVALAAQEAHAAAQLAAWDTELAKACKAERDRRVNGTLWTTATGSPLTQECQDAWTSWRQSMFRLTIDLPGPIPNDSGDWPAEPGLDYSSNA